MRLDIVIPVFNERENLPELGRRLALVCGRLPEIAWRVIYVDDGSTDDSAAEILRQHRADARFGLVALSRNFGHQAAITAGLRHSAEADAVVVMDGDLQDPPELIPDLLASWRGGAQVVRAERSGHRERGLRRLGCAAFYRILGWLSDFPIPTDAGIFGLLGRAAVAEINRLSERNRFLPGLRSWIGFEQCAVPYVRAERAAGHPKQTFGRLVRYALDGIFSFSYKPLRLMTTLGLVISGVGFSLACWFVLKRLTGTEPAPTGFTTLVTLVLFLGGIQLIAVGLLGEYLGRIYDEVKRRPPFIVRKLVGVEPPPRAETRESPDRP